jgi:2-isopropylmalate synthase
MSSHSEHYHNNLVLGVANSLVENESGARQVEYTIKGISQRAGNAALEEIAMISETPKKF